MKMFPTLLNMAMERKKMDWEQRKYEELAPYREAQMRLMQSQINKATQENTLEQGAGQATEDYLNIGNFLNNNLVPPDEMLPQEEVTPIENSRAMMREWDQKRGELRSRKEELRTQLAGRYGGEMSKRLSPTGFTSLFEGGGGERKLSPNERYKVLEGTGQVIDFSPDEGGDPKLVNIEGLKPTDKDFLYGQSIAQLDKNIKNNIVDVNQFYETLKRSDDPTTREVLIRKMGKYLFDNEIQYKAPEIAEQYRKLLNEDDAKNVVTNTSTVTNSDGTSTTILSAVDKQTNEVKELKRWTGAKTAATPAMVNWGTEQMAASVEAYNRIQQEKMRLSPTTTGPQSWASRTLQGWMDAITQSGKMPNQDQWESFKLKLYKEQRVLQQARLDTGVNRSVKELDGIKTSYGANKMSYWEYKASLEILEEIIEEKYKIAEGVAVRGEFPTLPKKVEVGSGLTKEDAKKELDQLIKEADERDELKSRGK